MVRAPSWNRPSILKSFRKLGGKSKYLLGLLFLKIIKPRGWPRGQVLKLARSAAGSSVFHWFKSWARTWHCSSNHAEVASHIPQLEGPTTKNIQLCPRGLWGEKGKKIKSLKKKTKLGIRDYNRDKLVHPHSGIPLSNQKEPDIDTLNNVGEFQICRTRGQAKTRARCVSFHLYKL